MIFSDFVILKKVQKVQNLKRMLQVHLLILSILQLTVADIAVSNDRFELLERNFYKLKVSFAELSKSYQEQGKITTKIAIIFDNFSGSKPSP